ncbi:hypothetical protein [Clostridium sporogenes]|uniref:hypothetical protein n=1 Tax=Clostridium sporogenes TaxID=1509 RepID=UPI00024BB22B|nr:hypothetical protein [Clostridium sporogenes]EHN14130.1 hypothetical protein IYC_16668 [Clostridium sporogenes PA 3679]NFQ34662.1 hypothetical protein [Clostridium sporogenes]NFQ60969.1 hypothetical protein [Clostridium sporogenes]NFU09019.1 hypothetical protein [Clostridium sporogenes]NFU43517.1 hypothetical protein [Clostridium sporogenes]
MDNFEYANDELGELINDGVFGENVKQLTNQFGTISNSDYYCKCLDAGIFNRNQVEIEGIKQFIRVFFKIILNATEVDPIKTREEITMFLTGDNCNKRVENLSSYTNYLLSDKKFSDELKKVAKQGKTIENIKTSSNALCDAYTKGIEYISKIYLLVNILFCITDNRKIDIKSINKKTLYDKCEDIKSRKVPEYNILVDSINRNIRNADAHLNINYNMKKDVFICKLLKKGKFKIIEIPLNDMCFSIYPKIAWIIKGFLYSIDLIKISLTDRDKFIEYFNKIFL